jgi:hypothetical protein
MQGETAADSALEEIEVTKVDEKTDQDRHAEEAPTGYGDVCRNGEFEAREPGGADREEMSEEETRARLTRR